MLAARAFVTLIAASASVSAAGNPSHACQLAGGWERAADQKPSPVPYSESIRFVAVQLQGGQWRWNRRVITETEFFRQLRQIPSLNPRPIVVFSFLPGTPCREKWVLQTRVAQASGCRRGFKPCLEGTEREYRAARKLP